MSAAEAMPTPPAESVKELHQAKYPGWTRLEWYAPDGHLKRIEFRGPGGEILPKSAFYRRVKDGEVLAASAPAPAPASPAAASAPEPAPVTEASALGLPDPHSASARTTPPGQASPAELALALSIVLVMLTSLLSLIGNAPELAMSEQEAQAIAVPAGNLMAKSSLNAKFGRYLANSSDYTLLGYGLYAYAWRVGTTLAARAQQQRQQQGQHVTTPPRGSLYAVPPTAQPGGPGPASAGVAAPGHQPGAGDSLSPDPRRNAASGGIAAQSSGYAGLNPIPSPRRTP